MKTLLSIVAFSVYLSGAAQQISTTYATSKEMSKVFARAKIDYLVSKIDKTTVHFGLRAIVTIDPSMGYRYNGVVYRSEVPGLIEVIRRMKADFPTVRFSINYAGYSVEEKSFAISETKTLNLYAGDGFSISTTEDRAENISSWSLTGLRIESFSFSPDPSIWMEAEDLIKNYLRKKENKTKADELIQEAERLQRYGTIEKDLEAKGKLLAAKRLDPDDEYIDRLIERAERYLENKREAKAKEEEKEVVKSKTEESPKEKPKEIDLSPCGRVRADVNMMGKAYYKYVNGGRKDLTLRDQVISSADYILSQCPYDASTAHIRNELMQEKAAQAQAIGILLDGASAAAEDIFTPHTIYGFGYTGYKYDPNKFDTVNFKKVTFQISGVQKFVYALGEIGYFQSPSYSVKHQKSGVDTGIKDTARNSGLWLSFGVGPSFRFFRDHIVINSVAQIAGVVGKTYGGQTDLTFFGGAFSAGILLRLGKFGIGANYEYLVPALSPPRRGESATDLGDIPSDYFESWEYESSIPKMKSFSIRFKFNFNVNKQ
ncbi:MAG TPA: hypothetical protein VF622_03335 [Segetibacter sp.]|jgi:hypothetical protein